MTTQTQKVAHTPGPWHWVMTKDGWHLVEATPNRPAILEALRVKERDACLISAAPDLLEALRVECYCADNVAVKSPCGFCIAKSALAKAQGTP